MPSESHAPRRRRHRSTRLASSRFLKEQKPFSHWKDYGGKDADKINSKRVYHLSEEYNRFLPFCEDGSGQRDPAVVQHGTAFEETVRDIERIIEEARMKVKHRCEDLEYQLDSLIIAAAKDQSSACPKSNLLDLKYTEMKDFLRHFKTQDPGAFSDYVIRTLQESSERDTFPDSRKEWKQEADMFLDRCLHLIQHMVDIDQSDMVLHALVALKSILRSTNMRLRTKGLLDDHEEIDMLIRAYVTEDVSESCKVYLSESSDWLDKRDHECRIDMGNLAWPARTGKWECRYHNFARAARILRTAYLDEDQYEDQCIYGVGSIPPPDPDGYYHYYTCFHHSSSDMLDWLQTKAWSEIRYNVMLTTGSGLPVEIAERIFEFALAAEEIPSHPTVKEKVSVEVPRPCRPFRFKRPRQRTVVLTKALYRCEAFDSEDEDELYRCDSEEDPDLHYQLVELAGTIMDFANISVGS